mmetsp:Transcript_6416/g.11158  ORF Transcript_6416/g.11158 Transcript_6416/m.11158 type:complete len:204 (-) Transcript_6416:9-620(-)
MDHKLYDSFPTALTRSTPSIVAYPTYHERGELLKKTGNVKRLRIEKEKQEKQLALPILNQYYRAKKKRKTERPQLPVDDQLGSISKKLSHLTLRTVPSEILTHSTSSRKFDATDAEKALSSLIKKCDNRASVSLKDQDSMRRIEKQVRRDVDRMKAFFRQKEKKIKYSDRRKYWLDEPVMTHTEVKSMIKTMRMNTLKMKVFV